MIRVHLNQRIGDLLGMLSSCNFIRYKKFARKLFLLLMITILIWFVTSILKGEKNNWKDWFAKRRVEVSAKHEFPKRILLWTTYWNKMSDGWEKIFYRHISRQCEESRCELVYSRQFLNTSDAVIFHPIDLPPHNVLPKHHLPHQIWIFFTVEAPLVFIKRKTNLRGLGGIFNWTMTYRRDSDVFIPYGLVIPKVHPSNHVRKVRDYWREKSKTKMAVWMVSHCETFSQREKFVKELSKHMKVDVFGRCGTKKCGKRMTIPELGSFDLDECKTKSAKYMFYFAFENAICTDYITEKFFLALSLNVVPVVFGGGDYETVAPPNSYINALNFSSPKALADYLKMVSMNANIYNKYFEWKNDYEIDLGHPFSPLICDLCTKLHNKSIMEPPLVTPWSGAQEAAISSSIKSKGNSGSYPDIARWFFKGSTCQVWGKGANESLKIEN